MASFLDTVLAGFDKAFGSDGSYQIDSNGRVIEATYWSDWGRKFCIQKPDGSIGNLGSSWWVRHRYDEQGRLISRQRLVHEVEPGDRVIYGHRAVYNAHEKQPGRAGGDIGLTVY